MTDAIDEFDESQDSPEKSKSEVKREFLALQDLGKELIELTEKQLLKVPLDDKIRDQILAAQSMQRGALKRQKQYIGKLLRAVDPASIHKALDRIKNQDAQRNAHFHRMERLRDKLIEDPQALTQFLNEFPSADRQQLHQMIRSAHKEKELQKPPAAAKQLFRYLRELMDEELDQ